jgi:hypothetical protein
MPDAKGPLCLESALSHLYTDVHQSFFRLLVDDAPDPSALLTST